ncbi:MAG: hypothetical protein ACHP8A_10175 [Terriglobales bacterium]|nr:nuclear transport factor 2 family protein [Terriglobales bacterium]
MTCKVLVLLGLFSSFLALAQNQNSESKLNDGVAHSAGTPDQQKIIEIEQKLAASTGVAGQEESAAFQKYLYDGEISLVDPFGRRYRMEKKDVVAEAAKSDPTDPDAKSVYTVSDFQVDIYGDTALAGYKQITTDSGHKNQVLNGEYSVSCLDTFIKRNGQWYALASACTPSAPIAQAQWDAIKK